MLSQNINSWGSHMYLKRNYWLHKSKSCVDLTHDIIMWNVLFVYKATLHKPFKGHIREHTVRNNEINNSATVNVSSD
jgi:hypothetical protein